MQVYILANNFTMCGYLSPNQPKLQKGTQVKPQLVGRIPSECAGLDTGSAIMEVTMLEDGTIVTYTDFRAINCEQLQFLMCKSSETRA